jgi:hypothetical protein
MARRRVRQIRALTALGRERGYLSHADIHDCARQLSRKRCGDGGHRQHRSDMVRLLERPRSV